MQQCCVQGRCSCTGGETCGPGQHSSGRLVSKLMTDSKDTALPCSRLFCCLLDRSVLPSVLSIECWALAHCTTAANMCLVLAASCHVLSCHVSLEALPQLDAGRTVLMYPSEDAVLPEQLALDQLDNVIIIDSKWCVDWQAYNSLTGRPITVWLRMPCHSSALRPAFARL